MRILFVNNKTYRGHVDSGWWYFYLPLRQMGHEVYFYNTVDPAEKDFNKVVETFKPELIFCMLTGDETIAPYEPWNALMKETQSGRTKTFNWFCDDTWRFTNFSSQACRYFTACSTPERSHLQKYKDIGYDNIVEGNWHAYSKHYPSVAFEQKKYDISFIGAPTPSRKTYFNNCSIPIEWLFGMTQEELFNAHANSKIGINLSTNDNDPSGATQMKQRIFEVPAGRGVLITEYHSGIEEYYEIDKEIITFKTRPEFITKADFLSKNPAVTKKISEAGHRRFLKDHDSTVRLARVLEEIMAI